MIDAPIPSRDVLPSAARLSRRAVSKVLTYAMLPTKMTEVGNASGPLLSFFSTSLTLPSGVTSTIALRSLAATQRLPLGSNAGPSAPSNSVLCAIRLGLPGLPSGLTATFQIAPRAVISNVENHSLAVKDESICRNRLLGLAVSQRAGMELDLRPVLSRSSAGTYAIDLAVTASGDI